MHPQSIPVDVILDPTVAAVLAAFPGAVVRAEDRRAHAPRFAPEPFDIDFERYERLIARRTGGDEPTPVVSGYVEAGSCSVSQVIYGAAGPMCHAQGWCVIPQQRRGRRLPSIYRGEAIKWGLYHDERPSERLVEDWSGPCFNENAAIVLGPPSGGVWALDMDVRDQSLANAVEEVAFRTMGRTPFRRMGNAPKRALFYRAAEPAHLPEYMSRTFVDEDGESPSAHALEFLGHRRMLTVYGIHHETSQNFYWSSEYQPSVFPPSAVPAVTTRQIEAFVEQVQSVRPFHKKSTTSGSAGTIVDWSQTGDMRIPNVRGGDWVEKDGLVVDGREKYLWALAGHACRANPALGGTEEGIGQLAAGVLAAFQAKAKLTEKWSSEAFVRRDALDKVRRAAAGVQEGRVQPIGSKPKLQPKPAPLAAKFAHGSWMSSGCKGGLAWLERMNRREVDVPFDPPSPIEEFKRRIPETPDAAAEMVARAVDDLLAVYFDAEFAEAEKPISVLALGPTGSGKTARSLRRLVMRRDARAAAGKKHETFLFLVPQYSNVDQTARDAEALGLKVIAFRGKAKSGCTEIAKLLKLQGAGRSTAGLCQAEDPDNKGGPTLKCKTWRDGHCSYQANLKRISYGEVDVVVAVHDYMTCPLPAAFRNCTAVIVDEAIHGKLLRSFRLDAGLLDMSRGGVARRTAKEKKAGIEDTDFDDARTEIVVPFMKSLREGKDPAAWFTEGGTAKVLRRRELLKRTVAVCTRVLDRGSVTPLTSMAEIDQMVSVKERRDLLKEARLWKIVEERVEALLKDKVAIGLARKTGRPAPKRKAPGDTDRRLHWEKGPKVEPGQREHPGFIRVSWTASHNFPDKPLLLLDASANLDLVQHVVGREDIVHSPIETQLRLRTAHIIGHSFSKSSFGLDPRNLGIPKRGRHEAIDAYRARMIVALRRFISHVAAVHPIGGIVVCLPLALRIHLCHGWCAPERVIWMHYGATKGLNIAERCSAAIAIGCVNPSLTQIDDIVAAIAYTAEEQEVMLDPIGTHRDEAEDGAVSFGKTTDTIRMRNGANFRVDQNAVDGRYAQIVLDQIRREEHLQFVGRLRPIFRGEITTLYNVGSYIPPSLIVDELMSWDDVEAFVGRAVETARERSGPLGWGGPAKENAEGLKLAATVAADPELRKKFFRLSHNGEVLWAPAHSPAAIEADGWHVLDRPVLEDMPEADDPYRCSFAEEVETRDDALDHALTDGWSVQDDGAWTKAVWVPTKRGPVQRTLVEDAVVVAQIYRSEMARQEIERKTRQAVADVEVAGEMASLEVDFAEL